MPFVEVNLESQVIQGGEDTPFSKGRRWEGHLHGIAFVSVSGIHHHMEVLSPIEHEAVNFWKEVLDLPLLGGQNDDGCLYWLRVSHVQLLSQPESVQHFCTTRRRGFVCELESNQVERLLGLIDTELTEAPDVALRLPLGLLKLCTSGLCSRIPVAHVDGSKRSVHINWALLGISKNSLPTLPKHLCMEQVSQTSEMNTDIAHLSANLIRRYASSLDLNSEASQAEHVLAQRCVLNLQALGDQLTDIQFLKMAKELHGTITN